MFMIQAIKSGGTIGGLILLLGGMALVAAIVSIVQLTIQARRHNIVHKSLLSGASGSLPGCWMLKHYLHAQAHTSLGLAEFRRLIAHHIQVELIPRLEQFRGAIAAVARISPGLGFLGTLIGLAEAFQAVGQGASPEDFATSINLAMATSIIGISVSLLLTLLLVFLSHMADSLHQAVAGFANSLAEKAYPKLFKLNVPPTPPQPVTAQVAS